MKASTAITAFLLFATSSVSSPLATQPEFSSREVSQVLPYNSLDAASDMSVRGDGDFATLEKRRGGGGRGGGGSSSSGGSGGSRGGGDSGSSGGSSSGSTSGGSRGGSTGGSTSSPARPSFGGGTVYAGGATSSYKAGSRSPAGITPFLIGGVGLGLLAASWPHGAYIYGWHTPYAYRNNTSNQNQSLPVECLCDPYNPCGCDDNNNSTYINSLILPNGTSTNETAARIQNVNGTQTVVLNGTLPNGTDTDDSSGSAGTTSAAYQSRKPAIDALIVAGVFAGCMLV